MPNKQKGSVVRRPWGAILGLLAAVICGALFAQPARAQGCIIAHCSGEIGGPENAGGYQEKGQWQLSLNYRHQYSFRHFVGDIEQVYRTQQGTEVRNRINIVTAQLSYQLTPRWNLALNLPVEFASRRYDISTRTPPILGDYGLSGMGDISLTAQRWMWNPENDPSHNIALGFGVQFPSGQDDIKNNLITTPGGQPVEATADYSIQPGIGGWAVPLTWQAFQMMGSRMQVYFNGLYLMTQGGNNGVRNGLPGLPPPAPQNVYVALADEYLMEAGVTYAFQHVKGLAFTFGPRDEGVPAHDVFGNDLGFRRPGYAVSLEPGIFYLMPGGHDFLTATIARAIYRNRTISVPDERLGTHGDAAFADWVWLASFTHRF